MEIDISTALFRLNNLASLKREELESIELAIAQLKGDFAPKFAELESVKNELDQLKNMGVK